MSDTEVIPSTLRESVGTGAARAARREGKVPAVVYGLDKEPTAIAIDELILNRLINSGSFYSQLYKLEIGGQKVNVLARDLQVHPVTDRAMHVDFLRVAANVAIAVEIPVTFLNEETCPGLLDGGILNVVRYSIEVSCRPDAIPEQIEVDLATAQLGDSIHISSVTLPDGVEPTIDDRDFTIATIAAPSVAAETDDADDETEAADGEETEGEAEAEAEESSES